MIESILNKVTAFTFNPSLRLLLGAQENRLNFRHIMDTGQVLIANLGRCDAETRRLVGSLIVTGMEQAARSRRNIASDRKPFYFCIDEFQDFCANDGGAQSLAQILSECRKFGLHLTLAHQTLAQVNDRMRGALGNIQLKIAFGLSREDAEIMTRHLFQVDGERIKHQVQDDLQQERSHPVFYSLQEEWEGFVQELQNLKPRMAFVKRAQRKAHLGVGRIRTIPVQYTGYTAISLENHQGRLAAAVGQARDRVEQVIRNRLTSVEEIGRQPALLREKVDSCVVV